MADLTAVLSADTSQLQKQVNAARQSLQGYTKEMQKAENVTQQQVLSAKVAAASLQQLGAAVTNPKSAMNSLKKTIQELGAQYVGLSSAAKSGHFGNILQQQMQGAAAAINALKKQSIEASNEVSMMGMRGGGVLRLQAQFKQLTNELQLLKSQYAAMSAQEKASASGMALKNHIQQVTKEAAELSRTLKGAKADIQNLANRNQSLEGLSQVFATAATGMGTLSAISAKLTGDENALNDALAANMAIMQGLNTIEQVRNTFKKTSVAMSVVSKLQTWAETKAKVANAAATTAQGVATKGATIAQKAFNAVAKANPYVLLTSAIVAVGAALYAFTSKTSDATDKMRSMNSEAARAKGAAAGAENAHKALGEAYAKEAVKIYKLKIGYMACKTEMSRTQYIKDHISEMGKYGDAINKATDKNATFLDSLKKMADELPKVAAAMASINLMTSGTEKMLTAKPLVDKRHPLEVSLSDYIKAIPNSPLAKKHKNDTFGQMAGKTVKIDNQKTADKYWDKIGKYQNPQWQEGNAELNTAKAAYQKYGSYLINDGEGKGGGKSTGNSHSSSSSNLEPPEADYSVIRDRNYVYNLGAEALDKYAESLDRKIEDFTQETTKFIDNVNASKLAKKTKNKLIKQAQETQEKYSKALTDAADDANDEYSDRLTDVDLIGSISDIDYMQNKLRTQQKGESPSPRENYLEVDKNLTERRNVLENARGIGNEYPILESINKTLSNLDTAYTKELQEKIKGGEEGLSDDYFEFDDRGGVTGIKDEKYVSVSYTDTPADEMPPIENMEDASRYLKDGAKALLEEADNSRAVAEATDNLLQGYIGELQTLTGDNAITLDNYEGSYNKEWLGTLSGDKKATAERILNMLKQGIKVKGVAEKKADIYTAKNALAERASQEVLEVPVYHRETKEEKLGKKVTHTYEALSNANTRGWNEEDMQQIGEAASLGRDAYDKVQLAGATGHNGKLTEAEKALADSYIENKKENDKIVAEYREYQRALGAYSASLNEYRNYEINKNKKEALYKGTAQAMGDTRGATSSLGNAYDSIKNLSKIGQDDSKDSFQKGIAYIDNVLGAFESLANTVDRVQKTFETVNKIIDIFKGKSENKGADSTSVVADKFDKDKQQKKWEAEDEAKYGREVIQDDKAGKPVEGVDITKTAGNIITEEHKESIEETPPTKQGAGLGLSEDVSDANELTTALGDVSKAEDEVGASTNANANTAEKSSKKSAAASKSATGIKAVEAVTNAVKSAAELPFPANIAAIAAAVAAVMGVLSMVGAFADGGIVANGSKIGDYNLARVNGGEMILNGSQQAKLFSLLNGNISSPSSIKGGGNVSFEIKGRKLVGVLNNHNKRMSRL